MCDRALASISLFCLLLQPHVNVRQASPPCLTQHRDDGYVRSSTGGTTVFKDEIGKELGGEEASDRTQGKKGLLFVA